MRWLPFAVLITSLLGCGTNPQPQHADKPSPPATDAMSYSLHFHTCNLGTETRDATNPFTGEKTVFHIDDGLTKAERQATLDLLTRFSATEPDPDGYYYIDTSDGAHIASALRR